METSAYMEAMVATRSQLLSAEEQLEGQTLISLETEDMGADDIWVYLREHFAEWLPVLRLLNKEQQEVMMSYYLLGKTQLVLARLFSSTQTVMSFRIRMIVKLMGAFIIWGGPPDIETMKRILLKAGYEHKLKKVALSQVISEYAQRRNFFKIADSYGVRRPDVRRTMSLAAKHLLGGDFVHKVCDPTGRSPEELALGAYIFTLIDKANPGGEGMSKRKVAKTARAVVLVDPPCVGEFRIAANDPGFDALFVSRANR